jgi:hypothetical protein
VRDDHERLLREIHLQAAGGRPVPAYRPSRPVPAPVPLHAHRAGDVVELAMVRTAHAFLAGRPDPVWYREGARVTGSLVRINSVMRRVVVALPEGLATFQEEDVEAV